MSGGKHKFGRMAEFMFTAIEQVLLNVAQLTINMKKLITLLLILFIATSGFSEEAIVKRINLPVDRIACENNSDCTCLSGSGIRFKGCSNRTYAKDSFAGSFECDICECRDETCQIREEKDLIREYWPAEHQGLLEMVFEKVYRSPCKDIDNPLFQAAFNGELQKVKELIAQGVGIDETINEMTPLFCAAEAPIKLQVISFLVDNGADIHKRDHSGKTIFMIAAQYSQLNLLKTLLGKGVDVNAKDLSGKTVLHWALYFQFMVDGKDDPLVRLLIEHGVDIDARDSQGLTALLYAAQYGRTRAVEMLIKHGADVMVKDFSGRTALHYVAKINIAELFIRAGADVNAVSNGGQTPLINAGNSNEEFLLMLLDAGAIVNVQTNDGHDALKAAIQDKDPFNVKILLVYGALIDQEVMDKTLASGNKEIINIVNSYQDSVKSETMMTHQSDVWPLYRKGRKLAKPVEPDFPKAKEILEQVVVQISPHELFPHYDDPHFLLAVAYEALKDFTAAIRHQQMAIQRDPSNIRALIGAGNVSLWLRDYQSAAGFYRNALALVPQSTSAVYGLSYAFSSIKGKCNEAKKLFEEGMDNKTLSQTEKQLKHFIDKGCPSNKLWGR